MKRITTAFLSILITVTAFSQPKMSINERLKMIDQKICKPLSLDNERSEKVKSYFK